ncbi:MAG: Tol-Pal system beta propeller repeat protein TolB [Thermodesulfovibrionales bacterium]|nr:Tol-Pal system beta propeller repeat protein TolB [Thermodesulfovibrionales bacterium]
MLSLKLKMLIVSILIATTFCIISTLNASKVYIDVNAPNLVPLPIAIQPFTNANEITSIVINDLNFTGIFKCINEDAQVERNEQPFNPNSWIPLGVVLVVKGHLKTTGDTITLTIQAFDVLEKRAIFLKEYSASKNLIRPLAHSVSNDIYRILTGQNGIFRTRLAYVVERTNSREIFISDYDGYRANSTGIQASIILKPRWSSNGKLLIYSAVKNLNWDIYLLNLDDMTEKRFSSPKGLNITGNFFHDNNSFLFSSSKDGKSNIYKGEISSSRYHSLIVSPWIDVSPSISPDGKTIAFVSNRSGSPQIYLANADGSNIRRLTFEGSYNTSPSWSPQGDKIVFTRMINGKQQIVVMKVDGSSQQILTDKGNNEDPSFSPDGRFIVFSSDREGVSSIFIMRENGDGQTRVSPRGFKAYSPSWSP